MDYCHLCGRCAPDHYAWCLTEETLKEPTGPVCSVCGLYGGAHLKECIACLIKTNTAHFAIIVNKVYASLLQISKTKLINFRELDDLLEYVRRETALLRSLNATVAPEDHTKVNKQIELEGCA